MTKGKSAVSDLKRFTLYIIHRSTEKNVRVFFEILTWRLKRFFVYNIQSQKRSRREYSLCIYICYHTSENRINEDARLENSERSNRQ